MQLAPEDEERSPAMPARAVQEQHIITIGTQRRLILAPMATDGGGGVQFTWMGSKP